MLAGKVADDVSETAIASVTTGTARLFGLAGGLAFFLIQRGRDVKVSEGTEIEVVFNRDIRVLSWSDHPRGDVTGAYIPPQFPAAQTAVDFQSSQPANPALAKTEAGSRHAADLRTVAEREIPYSSPSTFHQLLAQVQSELESRSCRIPQAYSGSARRNVIRGEFRRRGQEDWAVLCSKGSISSILIFWKGSSAPPAEIDPHPDKNFLSHLGNGKLGFSRAISPVGKEFILTHFRAYGGPAPPPIDHEGINDEFLEKGSVVHYFYRGQWLHLTGSD